MSIVHSKLFIGEYCLYNSHMGGILFVNSFYCLYKCIQLFTSVNQHWAHRVNHLSELSLFICLSWACSFVWVREIDTYFERAILSNSNWHRQLENYVEMVEVFYQNQSLFAWYCELFPRCWIDSFPLLRSILPCSCCCCCCF